MTVEDMQKMVKLMKLQAIVNNAEFAGLGLKHLIPLKQEVNEKIRRMIEDGMQSEREEIPEA